jgi:hypothetical protein
MATPTQLIDGLFPKIHSGVTCDGCGAKSFKGIRYK